ncbi:hypothetical protein H6764_01845 [Candidatus Nomurabacteria bacterium]|nr:hypothetical protein [Candidatus Nomurabacteria bacterium]
MDIIVKSALENLFISFIFAFAFAPIMIGILYRFNQVAAHKKTKLGGGIKGDNSLYLKIMNVSGKNGIPNMGGILIWVVVPILVFLLVDRTPDISLFILSFILFGFWGFLDVLFTNMIKNNPELRTIQEKFIVRLTRFSIAMVLNIFIMYLLQLTGIVPDISLGNWAIAFTPALIPVLGILGQLAIYAAELTDGLDGLMIGIFGISYTALGAVLLINNQPKYIPVIAIIIGVVVVDLYFNTPPARFYNGGPGAMPLGASAFYIAIATDQVIPYFLITGLTWIILLSSMIQIISMRFFKRRVFKMAPLHHHFQVLGWPEHKVTMRFWVITIFLSIAGIYLSVLH